MFDLTNKTALITGSSGGLGFTMAAGLARQGARVILNGRDQKKLEQAKLEIQKVTPSVDAYSFDVTDSQAVTQAAEQIINKYGCPHILVNNAGIQRRYPLEEFPEDEFNQVIEGNLKSAFLVAKALVKGMIQRKSGKIINICSLQSELGRNTIAPYAAAKGGLKMLTRAMATEWARHNIQVNAIGPGYFKTEMTRSLYENKEFDQWLTHRTPANRWGDPEELIGTLVFLASEASSYVNGQIVFVDGGITASM